MHVLAAAAVGTFRTSLAYARGAVANRVALEACQFSPELAVAAEVWQEITFEYEAVDTG
jgi:hypothetical protein